MLLLRQSKVNVRFHSHDLIHTGTGKPIATALS